MRILLSLTLLILATAGQAAEVYKTTDEHGNVVFTDEPGLRPAERVELGQGNTFSADEAAIPDQAGEDDQLEDRPGQLEDRANAPVMVASYEVAIVSPDNDEAVRENAGNVVIRVSIAPQLTADHRAILMLDGNPYEADLSGGAFLTRNLDRGTHTASVLVVDGATSKVLGSSEPVTFHLLRVSALHPSHLPASTASTAPANERPSLVRRLLPFL